MPHHIERRHLAYTAEQLFDLVADVERYPEFLQWFVAARIRHRDGHALDVDQTVRFAGFTAELATRAVLDRPRRIAIAASDPPPPLRRLDQCWTFTPASDGRTTVQYEVSVELRSSLLQRLMRPLLDERQMAEATINAFTRRAEQIYGPPHSLARGASR